jgi:hypothetical protein
MGSSSEMDELKKLIAGNHAEAKAWRQEDTAAATTLTATVDSLAVKVQDLAARITKLEPSPPPPEIPPGNTDASSAAPQLPDPTGTREPDGTVRPMLADKGILNINGTLHHGPELFPKKPFEETRFLKTARSSAGAGNSSDDLVPRYFKLDFPRFDGKEDPLSWLSRCEQYFRAQRTYVPQKIWLATFHLDGDAFHWYAHLERSRGVPSWEEFVELCNVRFGPPIRSNPLGELRLLRQTGTVVEYQSRFLALLNHADLLSDRRERQMFTSGLHDDIRINVELQDPRDLEHTLALARAFEKRATRPATRSGAYRTYQQPRPPPAPAPPTADSSPTRTIRRLTPAEMAEHRHQGLCFNCDENFVRGHKCAHLFLIEYDDSGLDDSNAGDGEPADDEPRISLYAVAGVQAAETVRLRVFIQGRAFLALIDSGSSHNFIRDEVAQHLGVPLLPVRAGLNVIVANGDKLPHRGFCSGLDVLVRVEPFRLPCFSLALGGYDIILGTHWLRTLGPILCDFTRLSMTCFLGGRRMARQGEPGGASASCRQLQAEALLDRLLEEFANLFAEPTGLPPARRQDHHIHLEEGAQPVAVQRYRYPQLQKDELERQCAEMMRQGIIRLSTSAYPPRCSSSRRPTTRGASASTIERSTPSPSRTSSRSRWSKNFSMSSTTRGSSPSSIYASAITRCEWRSATSGRRRSRHIRATTSSW